MLVHPFFDVGRTIVVRLRRLQVHLPVLRGERRNRPCRPSRLQLLIVDRGGQRGSHGEAFSQEWIVAGDVDHEQPPMFASLLKLLTERLPTGTGVQLGLADDLSTPGQLGRVAQRDEPLLRSVLGKCVVPLLLERGPMRARVDHVPVGIGLLSEGDRSEDEEQHQGQGGAKHPSLLLEPVNKRRLPANPP